MLYRLPFNQRIAAWGVAIVAVVGWQYYRSQRQKGAFTEHDAAHWNDRVKASVMWKKHQAAEEKPREG